MGDNSFSPHPTGNSATPFPQADPSVVAPSSRESDAVYPPWYSPLPPTANFQNPDKSSFSRFKPPRPRPPFQGFERPNFTCIAILTVLCLITYPAFFLLTFVARDRSLFVVRVIVSIWCSGIGFALGYILLSIGAQHLEAASEFTLVGYRDSKTLFQTAWATVIHMSYEGGGMKLRDLARGSCTSTSVMSALHVSRSRFGNRGAARQSQKSFEFVPQIIPYSTPSHIAAANDRGPYS